MPNKIITIREKDAPRMTVEINKVLLEKAKVYRKYVKGGRTQYDKQCLRDITSISATMIKIAKEKYFSLLGNKLKDPNIDTKKYWSILHSFLNRRKIPQIPPTFHKNTFVTNIPEKASLFNELFANKCTVINTNSDLSSFTYATNLRLETVIFDTEKIMSLIRSLNPNKAHGWDEISVKMEKICDDAIAPALKIIFYSALASGTYPTSWKKANVVPVHKKEEKNIIKNYRPISLLPIFGKIFEKCIYDCIYSYFEDNKKP